MTTVSENAWWKHGIIYQIYPRSFRDADNDGNGDLSGIIEKLDYLGDLGVDGIWLSPINQSPMYDCGYDISDYDRIDPMFGSEEDFDRLIREADQRGIKIVMDLVLAHTSHLHPWFLESRLWTDSPKRDWYIWQEPKNGGYPNNWRSAFGGRGWTFDEKTRQYYHHQFLPEQPQLNWRNPDVRKALFDMIRRWLDRGVGGFRLDVVNYFFKDAQLRDNSFRLGPNPRPYDLQAHVNDGNQPEIHESLHEFRDILNQYPGSMSVGEVWFETPGNPAEAAKYYGNDDELHLVFDFALLHVKKWNATKFFKAIETWEQLVPGNGWPTWTLGNHDQGRMMSRLGKKDSQERMRLLAVLLLALRGTPFLYYGDEIGMRNGLLKRKDLIDPVGQRYWPFHIGRDPARTPMQWTSANGAGFTKAAKPWLPLAPDYGTVNVQAQEADADSLLHYYRRLIAVRREHPSLNRGTFQPLLDGRNGVLAWLRKHESERALVVLNFKSEPEMASPGTPGNWEAVFSTHRAKRAVFELPVCQLAPYEASIFVDTTTED
jgi:alpha-glucosidase